MAGSVNKVILIGNLGADPEVKSFQNGGRIANLRIATSESWRDKASGEKKERTEWHTVVLQSDGLVGVADGLRRPRRLRPRSRLGARGGPGGCAAVRGPGAGAGGARRGLRKIGRRWTFGAVPDT